MKNTVTLVIFILLIIFLYPKKYTEVLNPFVENKYKCIGIKYIPRTGPPGGSETLCFGITTEARPMGY